MSEQPKLTGGAVAGPLVEMLRSSWFLIIFIGTVIYWAAKQDSASASVKKHDVMIAGLETRVYTLESGIAQLQLKLDGIKEDVALIKGAVIK